MKITRTHSNNGFTLVELMIVVAIIGILAMVALPNFIAYRYRAKIGASVGTADSIRSAFAGYASSESDNLFPATSSISSWYDLSRICNINGATLKDTEAGQGINFILYDDMGTGDDYFLILRVRGVPGDVAGCQIEIRSSGIIKQTLG